MKLLNGISNPLAHITCRDGNGLIGLGLNLPWSCKEDMGYFKEVTNKKVVIVGYNTFKSILSMKKKPSVNLENPILAGRIAVVISDPKRSLGLPIQNLNSCGITKLIHTHTKTDPVGADSVGVLNGFNVFVESLEHAIHVIGLIHKSLLSNTNPSNDYGDWHVPLARPTAYVIGGSKLYAESLENTYVSEIHETVLPVWCTQDPELTDVKYYYPEVDLTHYRIASVKVSRCRVTQPGKKDTLGDMKVSIYKRTLDISSMAL